MFETICSLVVVTISFPLFVYWSIAAYRLLAEQDTEGIY
jgi:hypothetical protein